MSDNIIDQTDENVEMFSEADSADNMATIASKPTDISRSDLIAKMVAYATKADKNELADFISSVGAMDMNPNATTPDQSYDSVRAAANAVGNNSEKNKATIKSNGKQADLMPSVKEDLALLFGGSDDLSEDFRFKVSTLFEAAVSTRVNLEVVKIEEDFDELERNLAEQYQLTLDESIDAIKSEMIENVDTYLNYAVAEWITENKLAVQNNIRTQIAESFMSNLKDVFEQHYVSIPDDQVDVVEAMAVELEEVKLRLEETASENIKLAKIVNEKEVSDITATVSENMTDTQKDKFIKLTEAINYSDVEEFRKKVSIIKETYFPKNNITMEVKNAQQDQLLSESVEEPEKGPLINTAMQMYVSTLSSNAKKYS